MIGNKIIINKLSKKRMLNKKKNTKKNRSNRKRKHVGGGGNKRGNKYNTINVKRARSLNNYASNVINSMNSRLDKLSKQIKY